MNNYAAPLDRPALVAHAQASIARGSKSFAAASRLFDRTTRERVWLLYAWCRACDDLADAQDFGGRLGKQIPADARLATIRDRTALAFAEKPSDDPAFDGFGVVARECGLTRAMAGDVIAGFALDAADWRPRSERDLMQYSYHVAGAVGVMMAVVMGVSPHDEDTLTRLWNETLTEMIARFGWYVLAYCQMGNHYHVLVETPQPNLSRGMRQLNGVYAQSFNRRHGRIGHVFQARFHATLDERGEHLLAVSSYVPLNPVRAGLCHEPADWRWSSYRPTIGLEPPGSLAVDRLLAYFADSREAARERYRVHVEERVGDGLAATLDRSVVLGSESSPGAALAASVRTARSRGDTGSRCALLWKSSLRLRQTRPLPTPTARTATRRARSPLTSESTTRRSAAAFADMSQPCRNARPDPGYIGLASWNPRDGAIAIPGRRSSYDGRTR